MGKFIQLTRKTCLDKKKIYVNVDAITFISQYGSISFIGDGSDCYPLEVEETPEQILEKLEEDQDYGRVKTDGTTN